MLTPNHVNANSGDVLILAGTMKGAFVLRSDKNRKQWEVGGPISPVERSTQWLTTIAKAASVFGPPSIVRFGAHT